MTLRNGKGEKFYIRLHSDEVVNTKVIFYWFLQLMIIFVILIVEKFYRLFLFLKNVKLLDYLRYHFKML